MSSHLLNRGFKEDNCNNYTRSHGSNVYAYYFFDFEESISGLRSAAFNRRMWMRCPLDNGFVLLLSVLSAMAVNSFIEPLNSIEVLFVLSDKSLLTRYGTAPLFSMGYNPT
jgi:hypothetical protein